MSDRGPVAPLVSFFTPHFSPRPGEEILLTPGRHGRALAQWLAWQFRNRGVLVDSISGHEGGWTVRVARKPYSLWIGTGNIEQSAEIWQLYALAAPPWWRRLFGAGPDSHPFMPALRQHLAAVLPSLPEIAGVHWEGPVAEEVSEPKPLSAIPEPPVAPDRRA